MAKRTLQAMIAQVQRSLDGSNITAGMIQRALLDAHADIQMGNSWPWNYDETNILIPPPLSAGTISIVNQTAVVTGSGTAFDTLYGILSSPSQYPGCRMRFGSNNVDYIVKSIDSATQITLDQPVNLGADLVASTYVLYQDTFLMPTDFMPGKDVILANPTLRMRIKHIPRFQFEEQMIVLRPLFTSATMYYTDHAYNATAKQYQIRFCPPMSVTGEYRLTYSKNPPDMSNLTDVTSLPAGYDECVELFAIARLKMTYGLDGAKEAQAVATGKIRLLKKQISSAIIDNQPKNNWGVPDSSFSQGGLMIGPWSN